MQLNGHAALDFWPVVLVAGTGLIAWGRLSGRVEAQAREIDKKVSAERVDALDSKLVTMDAKLDRIIDRLLDERAGTGG